MELMNFKSGLQHCFFDLQRYLKWYLRRVDKPNKEVINQYIEFQIKMLTPYIPHICEELWKNIGKKGFITQLSFPDVDKNMINIKIELQEDFFKSVLNDIGEILKVIKIKPKKIIIYTSPLWKQKIYDKGLEFAKKDILDIGNLMKDIMKDSEIRKNAKAASKYTPKIVDDIKKMNNEDIEKYSVSIDEKKYLGESKEFICKEFDSLIEIYSADDKDLYDPQNKARFAIPFRPAIYIE